MTLSTTENRIVADGNGVTDTFPFPYLFYDEDDLVVTVGGVVQTISADYTTTGEGAPSGGNVVFEVGSIPASGTANVVIERIVPLDQDADPQNFDGNPADSVEIVYDLMVMRMQQLQDQIDRAPVLSINTILSGVTYPDPVDEEWPIWDGILGAMINSGVTVTALLAAETNATASAAAASTSETNAATSETNAATSETNAATSETNAATSETNAATSETNAAASAASISAVANNWLFDASTVMSDPGTADLRLDDAAIGSVANIAISSLTNEAGNPDISDFIATWDDSTNTTGKGTIVIRDGADPAFFAIYNITGSITDNGSWLEIPVTFIDSNGTLSGSESLFVQFSRTGDRGAAGAGSGDMIGANNLSDVVSIPTSQQNINLEPGVDVEVFDAANAKTDVAQEYTKQQGFNEVALSDGANISWNLDDAQAALVTLAGNRTLDTPTNMKAGTTYSLIVKQDVTGSRTLAYGAAYLFPGGTAPTLTASANAVDVLTFLSDGTNMLCVPQGDFK